MTQVAALEFSFLYAITTTTTAAATTSSSFNFVELSIVPLHQYPYCAQFLCWYFCYSRFKSFQSCTRIVYYVRCVAHTRDIWQCICTACVHIRLNAKRRERFEINLLFASLFFFTKSSLAFTRGDENIMCDFFIEFSHSHVRLLAFISLFSISTVTSLFSRLSLCVRVCVCVRTYTYVRTASSLSLTISHVYTDRQTDTHIQNGHSWATVNRTIVLKQHLNRFDRVKTRTNTTITKTATKGKQKNENENQKQKRYSSSNKSFQYDYIQRERVCVCVCVFVRSHHHNEINYHKLSECLKCVLKRFIFFYIFEPPLAVAAATPQ